MYLKEPIYTKLIEYNRNNLSEQVHFGIIIHMNKNGIIKKIGEDNHYKFYHRSCMKPLQAAPLINEDIIEKYSFKDEEIAVCCASHTGDIIHQDQVLSILCKIGLSENDLLCLPHEPLSEEEQNKLIINNLNTRKIHNNCSGKHAAMLAICKTLNFPIENYTDLEHPLTKYILNQVCNLCETSTKEIIISKDGCGLPVIATELEALGKGFLNLFTNKKYQKLTKAIQKFPYIMGGKYRLDSEIINSSDNLIAKVGACGLCVVVNLKEEECIIVKIADSNMEARTITVIDSLLKLKWLNYTNIKSSQLNNIYKKEIRIQNNTVVGNINSLFDLS